MSEKVGRMVIVTETIDHIVMVKGDTTPDEAERVALNAKNLKPGRETQPDGGSRRITTTVGAMTDQRAFDSRTWGAQKPCIVSQPAELEYSATP